MERSRKIHADTASEQEPVVIITGTYRLKVFDGIRRGKRVIKFRFNTPMGEDQRETTVSASGKLARAASRIRSGDILEITGIERRQARSARKPDGAYWRSRRTVINATSIRVLS